MLELLNHLEQNSLVLSEVDCPDSVFCQALIKVGELITTVVRDSMIPKLRKDSNALRCALELAISGVMRLEGKPGDPHDADSVLVRCGLVQLNDSTARISKLHREDSTELHSQDYYLFLNREPMIQFALSEVIFDHIVDDQHFAMLEDPSCHVWRLQQKRRGSSRLASPPCDEQGQRSSYSTYGSRQ